MTTAVAMGSAWNFAGQVAALAVSFVTIPFVIRLLGSEGYGVLVLVVLIPTYFAFADFGMGVASTKFESEAHARGDRDREGNVLRASALIALVATSVIALPIILLATKIVEQLNVPAEWETTASYALRITAVTFVIGALASVLNSPMLARLRMDLNAFATALPKVLYSGGAPVALALGFGLVGVANWLLITSIVGLIVVIAISGKLLPELFGSKIDRSLFAPLMRFGAGWLFAVMAVMLLVNLEKLLLARMVSVQTLAYYSIAFTFANTALFLPQAITQTLLPAFARLLGTERHDEFQTLFVRTLRVSLLIQLPALTLMAVVARPLFRVWAGGEFEANSTWPFYVLLAGTLFNILASVPHSVILSAGRTELLAKLYWAQLLVYPFVAAALIYNFGIIGAAAAWSLRVAVDSILMNLICRRVAKVRTAVSHAAARLALPTLLLLPAFATAMVFSDHYVWIVAVALISLLSYAILAWRISLDEDERAWLRRKIARPSGRSLQP